MLAIAMARMTEANGDSNRLSWVQKTQALNKHRPETEGATSPRRETGDASYCIET